MLMTAGILFLYQLIPGFFYGKMLLLFEWKCIDLYRFTCKI